jgi:hypothetical protein
MRLEVAKNFARLAETDVLNQVILVIEMENETGKHYFSLDDSKYTCYPQE